MRIKLSSCFSIAIALMSVALSAGCGYSAIDRNYHGVALFNEEKYDEAFTEFNKAIEMAPDYAEAYFNRGKIYKDKYQYNEAISDFSKAIELKPDFFDPYLERGIIYNSMVEDAQDENLELAISDFIKAISLKPEDEYPYYFRGLAYEMKGKITEALADIQTCLGLSYKAKNDYLIDLAGQVNDRLQKEH